MSPNGTGCSTRRSAVGHLELGNEMIFVHQRAGLDSINNIPEIGLPLFFL